VSLRVRVALASVAGALVVLLAAGAALSSVLARQPNRDRDRQLTVVSDSLRPALLRAAQTGSDSADPGGTDGLGLKPGGTDTLRERLTARVAEATGLSYTALAVSGGQVVAQTGASRLDTASLVTAATGFSTVDAAGTRVRVRSQTTAGRTPVQVVVAVPLAPTDQRVSGLRRSVLVVGLLAVLASAALGWLLAGPAVRPLRRLRQRADEVGRVDPASGHPGHLAHRRWTTSPPPSTPSTTTWRWLGRARSRPWSRRAGSRPRPDTSCVRP
jgi:two-component system sensor histidine kinase PrrB